LSKVHRSARLRVVSGTWLFVHLRRPDVPVALRSASGPPDTVS